MTRSRRSRIFPLAVVFLGSSTDRVVGADSPVFGFRRQRSKVHNRHRELP